MNKIKKFIHRLCKIEIAPRGTFYIERLAFACSDKIEYEAKATYKIFNLISYSEIYHYFQVNGNTIIFDRVLDTDVEIHVNY